MTSTVEKGKIGAAQSARNESRTRGAMAVDIVWTQMGDGVWVAKRDADFAGLIEELWGAGYRVTDRSGAIIGEYATLQSARRRLE